MNRAEWEKEDYKKDVRNLLDQPVNSYLVAALLLNYIKTARTICEMAEWDINEILGGDETVDIHKEIYSYLTRFLLKEPADTKAKADFAFKLLREIENDCEEFEWDVFEILGGEVDGQEKETSEDEDVNQDIRCTQTGLGKQHVNYLVLPDQLSTQAI